jgi:transposase
LVLNGQRDVWYILHVASLQQYESHGNRYFRIVESYRKNGKPSIRVLAHLGRVDDILKRYKEEPEGIEVSSVSAGSVTALYNLAVELDIAGKINHALEVSKGHVRKRDGLSVGETLVAGMIGRSCAPGSKQGFGEWAKQTWLPQLMGFTAERITSQHFWDQMNVLPIKVLETIESEIVREVVRVESLKIEALAYDTTNFHTHIATTNTRAKLPQRGHNKQRRHDLRQLGLALAVDKEVQLPLTHTLYEGARSDMRTFEKLLKPIKRKMEELAVGGAGQLTFVFDAGASSKANLELLSTEQSHYVTAMRPSSHKKLLAEAAEVLVNTELTNGRVVKTWRGRREISGAEREIVVIFSQALYEGQQRGFIDAMEKCTGKLEKIGIEQKGTLEAVKNRLKKACAGQYVNRVIRFAIEEDEAAEKKERAVRIWCDTAEYERLTKRYFGLRVLISDRAEWSTAQIIEAYRGQSGVEAAFKDLKNPEMLAIRPQFHWTDQKLYVHTFMCVTAYLLTRLLWWRVKQATSYTGSSKRLLDELEKIRICHLVEHKEGVGRKRVRQKVEQMEVALEGLGRAARAIPITA